MDRKIHYLLVLIPDEQLSGLPGIPVRTNLEEIGVCRPAYLGSEGMDIIG